MTSPFVVAIDGPSGSGKSSTSRGVAQRLHLDYLDTGAMYRAMTWALLQQAVDLEDPTAVAKASADITITSGTDPLDPTIHVDGTDVAEPIRGADVTGAVSLVAAVPEVRARLVDLQRETIATSDGWRAVSAGVGTLPLVVLMGFGAAAGVAVVCLGWMWPVVRKVGARRVESPLPWERVG